jgi:hypothetical protein
VDANDLGLPTKAELIAKSLFSPSEEERQLAKMLASYTPEEKEPEHPLLLLRRLYPEGSEAARLASLTPVGQSVEEICAMQPDEILPNEEMVHELMEMLNQKPPKAPAPPEDPPKTLEERTSLDVRIREHGTEGHEIVKPPKQILATGWEMPKPHEPWDSADDIRPLEW